LLLLQVWGLIAAAAATVVAYVVFAIAGVWASHGRIGRSQLLASAAGSWLAAAPAIAFGALLPDTSYGFVVRVLLAGALLTAIVRPALTMRRSPAAEATAP